MDIQNSLDALKQMTKEIEKAKRLNDITMSKLPQDVKSQVAGLQAQMNQAMEAMKKGDMSKLTEIMNNVNKIKDANTN